MKIERNIPIPTGIGGKILQYPWPDMQPGDSILCDVSKCGESGARASQSFTDWALRNHRHDLRAICRTVAPGKVRIWVAKRARAAA